MKISFFAWLALLLGMFAITCSAKDINPEIVPLGHDTYALTRWATTGFARNTEKLKTQALEDAAAYCAKLRKELKVISTTGERPTIPLTGFACAKVVFKALDANDPELHAPVSASIPDTAPVVHAPAPPTPVVVEASAPKTTTDVLVSDLMKLDDLRKRGILTDEEFQAQKKKLLEQAK